MSSLSLADVHVNRLEALAQRLKRSVPAQVPLVSGGAPPTIAAETSTPVMHTPAETPSTQSPKTPNTEGCGSITRLVHSAFVYSETLMECQGGSTLQAIETCVQQKYEGSWHSSGTCRRDPSTGTTLSSGLTETSEPISCVKGRYYRAWGWFYTPYLEPKTSTELVPNLNGETLC